MSPSTNPYEVLEDVFDDIGEKFGEAATAWEAGETHEFDRQRESQAPLDVVDEDDVFVVTIDLPGFTRSDVSATVTDRILTILARHRRADTERTQTYVLNERTTANVRRSIQLPETIDAQRVLGPLDHGVLTVSVPKVVASSDQSPVSVDIT